MFRIGQKVVTVKNAGKIGRIVETGLRNNQGVQWVKVSFGKSKGRWTLADGIREYSDSLSIPIPHGIIVLKRPNHPPEVFQQTESKASQLECEVFLDTISRMFLAKSEHKRSR